MNKIFVLGISALLFGTWAAPASAAPDSCTVRFGILGNATQVLDLGTVAATAVPPKSKRQKCKERAITHCSRAEVKALVMQYAPVGSANFQTVCAQGGQMVWFDTTVDNHTNSKDGQCKALISCTRPPCPFTNYSSLGRDGEEPKLARAELDTAAAGCELAPRPTL
jgi:hypothetical protein